MIKLQKDTVSINDMAVQYGFSVFETFLIDGSNNIFLLDKHIDRLYRSMDFFGFHFSYEKKDMIDFIKNYVSENSIKGKVLRITVTYGNKSKDIESSVIVNYRENQYTNKNYEDGLKLYVSNNKTNENSNIVFHKTSNYLENLLIGKKAKDDGYDDAVLLNSKARVAETTRSNIFYVSRGILYTPSMDCGILPGITREWVIEECNRIGLKCQEDEFTLNTLLNADEVFLTNSIMGIMPVNSINEGYKRKRTSPITMKILENYKRLIK